MKEDNEAATTIDAMPAELDEHPSCVLEQAEGALRRGQDANGVALALQGLLQAETSGDLEQHGRACNLLGIGYMNIGDFPSALEYYDRALDVATTSGNELRVAATLHNIGVVYSTTAYFAEAIEHFYRAQALNEQHQDLHHLANNISAAAAAYRGLGNTGEALSLFGRACELYEKLEMREDVALMLLNAGSTHLELGNKEDGFALLLQAFENTLESDDTPTRPSIAVTLATAYAQAGVIEKAVMYHSMARAYNFTRPADLISTYSADAAIHVAKGEYEEALCAYSRIQNVAETSGMRNTIVDLLQEMRDLALKRNDFASYVRYNDEYLKAYNELKGNETAVRVAMLAKQREIDVREKEHQKHLAVLHSTLPKHIADRVARGEVVNDSFDNAAVLFLDVVDFTTHSSELDAPIVVGLLQEIFTAFDGLCAKHDVMKIKTIGDSYMAVAFPSSEQQEAGSEQRVANAARSVLQIMLERFQQIQVRIGIHCGPVMAGVIGTARLQYDVWGDTVNVASRMESTSEQASFI